MSTKTAASSKKHKSLFKTSASLTLKIIALYVLNTLADVVQKNLVQDSQNSRSSNSIHLIYTGLF